jgi:uncharacterized protein YjbI with pentapeptide repeats
VKHPDDNENGRPARSPASALGGLVVLALAGGLLLVILTHESSAPLWVTMPLASLLVVAGFLLWFPTRRDLSSRSELGAALLGGALVALAILYLQSEQEKASDRESFRLEVALQPDLKHSDLRGQDLSGLLLRSKDLSGAQLGRADARGADFTGSYLIGADMRHMQADGTRFEYAVLSCGRQAATSTTAVDGEAGAGATQPLLTTLRHADLPGAALAFAKLVGTDLRDADLSDADLRHTDLRDGRLQAATRRLDGAVLVGARLSKADLRGVNLSGADLRRADLRGARLGRATLRGARLEGALTAPWLDALDARTRATLRLCGGPGSDCQAIAPPPLRDETRRARPAEDGSSSSRRPADDGAGGGGSTRGTPPREAPGTGSGRDPGAAAADDPGAGGGGGGGAPDETPEPAAPDETPEPAAPDAQAAPPPPVVLPPSPPAPEDVDQAQPGG